MSLQEEMRAKLEAAFAPSDLLIRDDSERHRGHAGYQAGGESHWHISMTSQALGGLSRVQMHRAVHNAPGPAIIGRIHALELKLKS
jgi:BolA protein